MAIRINLLAEAQALEEMRRRDPVKRAVYVGILLVILMLAWCSSLQLKALIAKGELGRVEGQLNVLSNDYVVVQQNQKDLTDVTHRLLSLHKLATNRVLHGNLLDAAQRSTIPDVEMVRLRTEITHVLAEEIKAKTNSSKSVTAGRPASVKEQVVVTIDARDVSQNPGDQVNKYKQKIGELSYFQGCLGATNEVRLVNLSPPQLGGEGKHFVLFTLECRYPEKTR